MAAGLDSPETLLARASSRAAPAAAFEVDVSTALEPFLERCARLNGTPPHAFHQVAWLRAWYHTLGQSGGRRPVLVGVRRQGADVMLLPLCSSQRHGLSVLRFADARVVDYNLPLLAPGLELEPGSAAALVQAVRHGLRGHDVLLLEKMLAGTLGEAAATANPLIAAMRAKPCEQAGNQFMPGDDWDAWRYTLDKRVRKEFERAWRVFTRSPMARFERVVAPQAARLLFETLEAQQAQRMHLLDYDYVLDEPAYRDFYRTALEGGLADGTAVLTALCDGDQVVAAQFGISNGARYVALRLSIVGDEWKACSPGRLLIERTARHLHEQGLRWFDFGIGAYFHKETFNVEPIPLHDACFALSGRGAVYARWWALRRAAKRSPRLVKLWRAVQARQSRA